MAFKNVFNGDIPSRSNDEVSYENDGGPQIDKRKMCLKKVPLNLNEDGVRNMCAPFGKIVNVNFVTYANFSYFFITFRNQSETTEAIRHINDTNKFGIIAEYGKPDPIKPKKSNSSQHSLVGSDDLPSNAIRYENRNIKGPFSEPQDFRNQNGGIRSQYENKRGRGTGRGSHDRHYNNHNSGQLQGRLENYIYGQYNENENKMKSNLNNNIQRKLTDSQSQKSNNNQKKLGPKSKPDRRTFNKPSLEGQNENKSNIQNKNDKVPTIHSNNDEVSNLHNKTGQVPTMQIKNDQVSTLQSKNEKASTSQSKNEKVLNFQNKNEKGFSLRKQSLPPSRPSSSRKPFVIRSGSNLPPKVENPQSKDEKIIEVKDLDSILNKIKKLKEDQKTNEALQSGTKKPKSILFNKNRDSRSEVGARGVKSKTGDSKLRNFNSKNDHTTSKNSMGAQYSRPGKSYTQIIPVKGGPCLNCGQDSTFICRRCKCFYCSRICQSANWPLHKTTCNEMPELDVFQNIIEKPQMNGNHQNSNNQQQRTPPRNNNPQKNNRNKNETPDIRKGQSNDNNSKAEVNKPNENTIESDEQIAKKMQMTFIEKILPPVETPVAKPCIIARVPFPKDKASVQITHPVKPNMVYIRPTESKLDSEYTKILNYVFKYAVSANKLTKLPIAGDVVLGFYDDSYYRALVLKGAISDNHIPVGYIDFGNSEVKHLDDLRELRDDLKSLPRHSLKCKLKNVEDEENEEAMDYLGGLIGTDLEIRYQESDIGNQSMDSIPIPTVELYDIKTGESINKRIQKIMKVEVPSLEDPVVLAQHLPKRHLPVGKNIELIITDNSVLLYSFLSCTISDWVQELDMLTERLNRYCSKLPEETYSPREEEICLVKSGNTWYRGRFIESVGDGSPSMEFIDLGNISPINISHMHKMPHEFAKIAPCTVSCMIQNVPEFLSTEQLKKLHDLLPRHKNILCDTVLETESDDDVNEIEINTVITLSSVDEIFKD